MEESPYLHGQRILIEKLKRLPFLQHFDENFLEQIFSLSKLRSYKAGETITPEGVYDSWIYILVSGSVNVVKHGNNISRLNQVGDTFGKLTVLDGDARSASVEAETDTICLAMDASFLDRLALAERNAFYSIFYRLFAELLSQRLRNTSDELVKVKEELHHLKSTTTGSKFRQ